MAAESTVQIDGRRSDLDPASHIMVYSMWRFQVLGLIEICSCIKLLPSFPSFLYKEVPVIEYRNWFWNGMWIKLPPYLTLCNKPMNLMMVSLFSV